MLDLVYRNELPPVVVAELDQQLAVLNAYLLEEHKDDGTHAAITADSLTLTETQQAPTTTGFLKFVDRFSNQARVRLTGTAIGQSYLDQITAAGSRVRLFNDGAGTTEVMSYGALESALSMGLLGPTVRMASGFEDWGWGVGRDSFDDFMAPISFTGAETPFKIYRDNASSIFQVSPPDFGVYTHYLGNPAQSKFDWDKIAGKEVYARTAYYERARTVALGEWIAVAYAAGNFTASAGNWTVDSADVLTLSYTLIGKTMIVVFSIQNTDVSAAPSTLRFPVPGGFTIAKETRAVTHVADAGVPGFGMVRAPAGDTTLYFYASANTGGAWTTTAGDNTNVFGQIAFEIQ